MIFSPDSPDGVVNTPSLDHEFICSSALIGRVKSSDWNCSWSKKQIRIGFQILDGGSEKSGSAQSHGETGEICTAIPDRT
jgi:hypothetical protein